MNTPEKTTMHRSIFYIPRNLEMLHENQLIENRANYKEQKQL